MINFTFGKYKYTLSHWPLRFPGPILGGCIVFVLFAAVFLGPLVVHIVWCIQMAALTGSAIALLVAGLLIPPLGWVHGMSVLLGFGGWV